MEEKPKGRIKKEGILPKLARIIFSDDPEGLIRNVVDNSLKPGLQRAACDAFQSFVYKRPITTGAVVNSFIGGTGNTDYHAASNKTTSTSLTVAGTKKRSGFDGRVCFQDSDGKSGYDQAREVYNKLGQQIMSTGWASIGDLYEFASIEGGEYTNHAWGWKQLPSLTIVPNGPGEYILMLGAPINRN